MPMTIPPTGTFPFSFSLQVVQRQIYFKETNTFKMQKRFRTGEARVKPGPIASHYNFRYLLD